MSESKTIQSTPHNTTASQLVSKKRSNPDAIPCRPSYSLSNATSLRSVFDKMIETRNDQEISSTETGLRVSTLYLKAQDALKWLVDNDLQHDKYAVLRTQITIKRMDNGILLAFKQSIANLIAKGTTTAGEKSWMDEFSEWLETAQSGERFDKVGVEVSDSDKKSITNTLSQLEGTEADIGTTYIHVMR